MSSNGNRGGRRLRVALASAIAAFGVGAVGVSSASADDDHPRSRVPEDLGARGSDRRSSRPPIRSSLRRRPRFPGAFTINNDLDINDRQQITVTRTVSGGTYTITVDR